MINIKYMYGYITLIHKKHKFKIVFSYLSTKSNYLTYKIGSL